MGANGHGMGATRGSRVLEFNGQARIQLDHTRITHAERSVHDNESTNCAGTEAEAAPRAERSRLRALKITAGMEDSARNARSTNV